MSKPLGLSPTFQIIRSSAIEDKIYDVVDYAITVGYSIEDFFKEAKNCWYIAIEEKKISDQETLDRLKL